MKVHKPSRKSEAICLPVLSRTSRDKPRSIASSAVRATSVVRSASVGTREGCGGRESCSGRGRSCGRGGGGRRMASGDSKDSVRAWRDPEKTVRLEVLLPLSSALRRSMSYCREAGTASGTSCVAWKDWSLCTLRGSCWRFLCASWAAHVCLRRCSSCSALTSSSLNSSTRRSWAARAVRKAESVGPAGGAGFSASRGVYGSTGESVADVGDKDVWIGNVRLKRFALRSDMERECGLTPDLLHGR